MGERDDARDLAAVVVPIAVGSGAGFLAAKATGSNDLLLLGVFAGLTVSLAYITSAAAQKRYERGEGLRPR